MRKTSLVRAHLYIKGIVQGVGFRYSMRRIALKLGVNGWVRNLPDGVTVEAVIEGPRDSVEKLIEWAKQGPRYALVKSIKVVWESPKGEIGFRVIF